MAKSSTIALVVAAVLAGCGGDDDGGSDDGDDASDMDASPMGDGSPAEDSGPQVTDLDVDQDIDVDTTWSADVVYHLEQNAAGELPAIFVNPGATLTIEPGTRVLAGAGSALVVARGARIIADGTREDPIVFSLDAPVGERVPGEWGGLLLLGDAPYNLGSDQVYEAFPGASDPRTTFGGADPDDDSGVLRYVRVEFAGAEIEGADGLRYNGVTLAGIGRGTTIDHVQSHLSADDGIEVVGGTVNLEHIVSSQNADDGVDSNNGWTGSAQFIIAQNTRPSGAIDPSGFESDNCAVCGDVAQNRTPRTAPTIYNATLVGNRGQAANSHGALLRRDTTGIYRNLIIVGFATSAIAVSDAKTCAHVEAGTDTLSVQSSIFFDSGADGMNWLAPDGACDEATAIGGLASNSAVEPMLTDPLDASAPSFAPMAGSPALDPANHADVPVGDAFWEPVDFVGAIGDDDWTAGWTAYPQG